jgi:hypothetical protein
MEYSPGFSIEFENLTGSPDGIHTGKAAAVFFNMNL